MEIAKMTNGIFSDVEDYIRGKKERDLFYIAKELLKILVQQGYSEIEFLESVADVIAEDTANALLKQVQDAIWECKKEELENEE